MVADALSLAEVNRAINAILTTGKSYTRQGFSLTRADLKDLIALRDTLTAESARASGDGISFVSDFSGGG